MTIVPYLIFDVKYLEALAFFFMTYTSISFFNVFLNVIHYENLALQDRNKYSTG